VCATATLVAGIVLARSVFEHSMTVPADDVRVAIPQPAHTQRYRRPALTG
jgi:hypothetical protein